MFKATIAGVIISANLFTATAMSQEVMSGGDARLILWDKVSAGMAMAEVRALYPEARGVVKWHGTKQTEVEDVTIIPDCRAEVEIQHANGIVDAVKIKGRGSIGGRCSDKVLAALSAKYGQPAVQRKMSESFVAREGEVSVWTRDGITMRFKQFTNGAFGGGGLGSASWEMTYSASASEISL